MYRATTPVHTFTLPSDTSVYSIIQVTYKQLDVKLVKEYKDNTLPDGMTLDGKNVIVKLSQEETMLFKKGAAKVQIRVMNGSGDVMASQKFTVSVDSCYSENILQ